MMCGWVTSVAILTLGITHISNLLINSFGISRKPVIMCIILKAAYSLKNHYRFDEHAEYDLPAMIDYVLQETQEQQLTYVGYSQGSVMGFAGFSTQPKLAAKVKLFVALAPVARVSHIKGAVAFIAKFYREINVCQHAHACV